MYRVFVFCLLMAFWLFLSGKLDAFHITLGVLSSVLITIWSGDMLISKPGKSAGARLRECVGAVGYILWLARQVIVANLHVIALAFHPRTLEKIDPHLVEFRTTLTSDFARFVYANSITLTPGTVTVVAEGDRMIIHAIDSVSAADTMKEMERRIAKVFDS